MRKSNLFYATIAVGVLALILAILIFMSKVAVVNAVEVDQEQGGIDAHFFVRYDHTVQDENGNSHYDAHRYFPIGSISVDYDRNKNESDYTSADGKVKTNAAFVKDAKLVIDDGELNIFHQFGATYQTIRNHFKPVYDNISSEPSKEVMAASIERALGSEMRDAYNNGKVDVLWYVIKQEKHVHVDGVLYWTASGDVVEEGDENDPKKPEISKQEEKINPQPQNPGDQTPRPPQEDKSKVKVHKSSPQTGDTRNIAGLVACLISAAAFGTAALLYRKGKHIKR